MTPFSFFLITLLTATVTVLPPGDTAIENNTADLESDETLDVSPNVKTFGTETKTIGGIQVELTKEVKFNSSDGGHLTIKNKSLTSATVTIPDQTKVKAPNSWNGKIIPPKQTSTSGTTPAGFQTPVTSISVGSVDVILVFDKAITILLEGVTGQTAFKTPGSDIWNLISTCVGTYENPVDPPINGECSISNGINTKIVTFHFTEFTELSTIPASSSTPTASTSSSGSSGGSSGGGGKRSSSGAPSSSQGYAGSLLPETTHSEFSVFPNWFQTSLVTYWIENLITDNEFKNAMNYMLNKNIIKIDVGEKKDIPTLDLAPSIKQLFKLWSLDKLTDSTIIEIIVYYRTVGAW
ncbi:hypothetical protein NZNM25_01970 [Nitrosopumilus zosterae]|uniref:Uncharacterized protein n=1 Tax=Nitrosopumilus zosterae TaxID=718286 RepID=A0A2S2KP30_9ARCH|nr:hypothetical protein [Nitrosopumilus zosterae]BDQ31195.1 hypothetical protein NZOSNM25_001306 [Nitrosopumilus zosterae]GBH33406.1 hypothetical protein NZNM25_01970 [Nitrosopumilus zosterae]